MDEVIQEARQLYQSFAAGKRVNRVLPSGLWAYNFTKHLGRGIDIESLVELVHFLQEVGDYAHPRTVQDPLFECVTGGYRSWLESQGHPLSSYPSLIQESHLSSPKTCVLREGRRISAHFLYHLCICARILDNVPRPIRTVLEIGAGYGGVARLFKLFEPSVQYWIVDLPETIYFSHSFLRGNFPEAKCAAILADSTTVGEVEGSDFVFVPIDAVEQLAGLSFDLAVNTASFGEMTQNAVDRYFDLLQQDVSVRYLYSMNRYGQFPATRIFSDVAVRLKFVRSKWGHWGTQRQLDVENAEKYFPNPRTAGPGTCDYATPFDPYWSLHLWHAHGDDSFTQIEPVCPPYLECLAERIPKRLFCDAQRKHIADNLLEEATKKVSIDREWERLLWESVRVFPCDQNMGPWLQFLQDARYDEYNYFKRRHCPDEAPPPDAPPAEHGPTPEET